MRYVLIVFLVVACSDEQKPTAPAGKAVDFSDLFGLFGGLDNSEEEENETAEEEAETDSTSSEGGPDLIVQSPSVNDSILTSGQEFILHATVHNQGDEQAAATMLHYYRSNNATITPLDTEVGTDEIGVLDASDSSAVSIALTAPTSVGKGIYFYGACVDSVSSESNTDNNCSSALRITVSGQEPSEEGDETTQDGTDGDIASGDDETDDDTASDPSTRLLTHSGRGPRWSSDGQRIAFYSSRRNGWWDIYSIDPDGTNETRLTIREYGGGWAPTWSPDGLQIAFVSRRDGYESIHIMDADGTNETRLTENYSQDGPPAWSPDGRRIAYVSSHRINNRENREVYVMDPDGFNKEEITRHVNDWLPEWYPLAWSPDSQRMVFLAIRNSSVAIYIMDADGSNKKRLTPDNKSLDPAWSPDGTSIAYSSLHSIDDGLYEIYVMAADGSNKQRLTWSEGSDRSPAWSPDGERIAFVSERDGDMEVYVMDADGRNEQRLTYGAGKGGNVPSDLAWSPDPDSQRIVFERDRAEEIYIVEFVD